MIRIAVILAVFATSLHADALTTTRAIRPATVLAATDLILLKDTIPGALTSPSEAVGYETKVTLYPGQPIRPEHIGPPTLVDRNQLVEVVYRTATLTIRTEGRALDRGAAGERIRVMNLSSRSTISGVVTDSGLILVTSFGGNS